MEPSSIDFPVDAALLLGTLGALLRQSARGCPTAGSLARSLGRRPTDVAKALLHLERRGLVDPGRVRLTMRGLAVAVALQGRGCRSASTRVEGAIAARSAA